MSKECCNYVTSLSVVMVACKVVTFPRPLNDKQSRSLFKISVVFSGIYSVFGVAAAILCMCWEP